MWDSNLKLRKHFHKFRLNKVEKKSLFVQNGQFGLRVLKSGFLRLSEIKSINLFFKKTFKKSGKLWFTISPNLYLTKKPLESRMGKGKGPITEVVAVVQKGHIILEVETLSEVQSLLILQKIKKKLALPCKVIKFLL